MLKKQGLRKLLEARVSEACSRQPGAAGERAGRAAFVEDLRYRLGLMVKSNPNDPNSSLVESVDGFDRPSLAEGRIRPEEFSLRELAEAICGEAWVEGLRPGDRPTLTDLMEAGPGVDPTSFVNVSTYSAAVTGLLEARILERFTNAAYVGDRLVSVMPSRKSGEKLIGTTGFSSTDGDNERKPGMPHPRAQFGERYVTTPETVERGLACEVTREAVFFDLTNEVLDRAGQVGDALAYGKEKLILDGVIGATNPYSYGGVAYNTYQTSAPWVNSHDNAMVDYDNVDKALNLFARMTDPETGREIIVNPNAILHVPRRRSLWETNLFPNMIRNITNTNTATYSVAPSSTRTNYELIESQTYYNRLVASGVDTTKALDYWFLGDFQGAFVWVENWPLTVRTASPTDYVMIDRQIVVAVFANHRGVFAVKEPRKVVRNIKG